MFPPDASGGTYAQVTPLATGGMAELLSAVRTGADGRKERVAIKRILEHLCDEEEFLSLFASEARLAMRLEHPNIVDVLATGEANGVPFMVMEWLDGADLGQWLSAGTKFHPAAACAIGASVARALDYAHNLHDERGSPLLVVHRDLSPHNMFLTRSGEVKILDFG
ncbi:MAG: serine/threonine-protein kinase, partial [Polyangiaceae bacterium]